jgi:peptidoglycan/LPS O-acetylase OafA/YrhL
LTEGQAAAPHRRDPSHRAATLPYMPALDGLRAVFVASVVAFHLGVPGARGLYMGVDGFFVLSGYLITSLLLLDWEEDGRISFGRFYARRARRLLPALLVLLAVVVVGEAIFGDPSRLASIRGDVLAALFYSSNWYFTLTHSGYFGLLAAESPLQHTWSLAIEEQFYILWPLALRMLLGRLGRRRAALASAVGAVASSVAMALIYGGGSGLNEAYYGTECRAQALLAGCTLALLWPDIVGSERLRALASAASYPAAVGAGAIWALAGGPAPFMFRGGFLASDACVAVVIAGVLAYKRNGLGALLSLTPFVGLGRISYGVYLWMFPVAQVFTAQSTGYSGPALLAIRCGAILAAATASYFLVEQPVRARGLPRGALAWVAGTTAVAAITLGALVVGSMAPEVRGLAATGSPTARMASYNGPPVRVFFAGDSVSLTLAVGLSEVQDRYHVAIDDAAILGCGVLVGGRLRLDGAVLYPAGGPTTCAAETSKYEGEVREFAPDVVVLLAGDWERADWDFGTGWEHLGQPAFDSRLRQQLRSMIETLHSTGAPVVLLTCPYFQARYQPDGSPYPQDDPSRVDRYNAILRQVASQLGSWVHVIDLNKKVDPGGHYAEYINGFPVRDPDGIHFSHPPSVQEITPDYPSGGRWLAPWLLPQLFEIGLEYRQASS